MRNWKRITLVAIVLAIVTGYAVLSPYYPKYRALARVQVVAQPPMVLFRTAETEATTDDYKRFQTTQLTLVKSVLVLRAALGDKEKIAQYKIFKGENDPTQWLDGNLKVEFVAGSEVLEISLSGEDPIELAGIVNAVKKAYMDEVVNVDAKRRADRLQKLKKIKEKLKERRAQLRNLADAASGRDRTGITGLERSELLALYHELRTKRLDLQLEQAEAEAGLARRKNSAGPATEPVRKDIDRIEDRIGSLKAQEKVIDQGLEEMTGELRNAASQAAIGEALSAEITAMDGVSRQVTAEVEALTIELEAPPRIRTIEDATPPLTRSWGGR
jgi:chaperonin cofactor prefoldin